MKKIIRLASIIFFAILFVVLFNIKSYAAKGSFSVSPSSANIEVGTSTSVTIKVNNCEGKFTFTSSDSSVVTVNKSNEWIDGSTTLTLTAKKAGTAKVTITATEVADTSENDVTGSQTVTITVKEKASTTTTTNNSSSSKSSDATLKSLSVKGHSLNKKFSSGTTKYSISVENSVESVTVNATANSSKAKVAITGNKNLKVGGNTVNVTVTAEDGTKKVYKINVSRQADEGAVQSNPEEEPVEEIKLLLKSLEIEGYKVTPEFSPEVYEYSLTIPEEDYDVEKLDIKAVGDSEDFIVEITGNEELVEGENIITITVKSPNTADVVTYKINVIKEAKAVEAVANIIEEDEEIQEEPQISMLAIGVIVFTAVVAIAGIIFAVVEYKYGKKQKEEDEEFGAIPYANLGFHSNDDDKVEVENTLKNDTKEENEDTVKTENREIENEDIKNFIEEKIKTEGMQSDNLIEELYNKKTESQILEEMPNEDTNNKTRKRGRHF